MLIHVTLRGERSTDVTHLTAQPTALSWSAQIIQQPEWIRYLAFLTIVNTPPQ
jgi:hypothetical protein